MRRLLCFIVAIITLVASLPTNNDGLTNSPDNLFSSADSSSIFDDDPSSAPLSLSLNEAPVGQGLIDNNDLLFDPPYSTTDNLGFGSEGGGDLASSCHSDINTNDNQPQSLSKRKRNPENQVCTDPPSKNPSSSGASVPNPMTKIIQIFGNENSDSQESDIDTAKEAGGYIPTCPLPRYPVHLCCQTEGPLMEKLYLVHEYYWFCRYGTYVSSSLTIFSPFSFFFDVYILLYTYISTRAERTQNTNSNLLNFISLTFFFPAISFEICPVYQVCCQSTSSPFPEITGPWGGERCYDANPPSL